MFTVGYCHHDDNSFCSSDECRSVPSRPSQLTWAVSPAVGCYRLHLQHQFIIITDTHLLSHGG